MLPQIGKRHATPALEGQPGFARCSTSKLLGKLRPTERQRSRDKGHGGYVPLFIFKVNTVYIQYTDIQYHIFPAFLIIRFGTLFHSGPATVVATSVGNIAAAVCSSSCCCFCCGCWLAASQVAFICK